MDRDRELEEVALIAPSVDLEEEAEGEEESRSKETPAGALDSEDYSQEAPLLSQNGDSGHLSCPDPEGTSASYDVTKMKFEEELRPPSSGGESTKTESDIEEDTLIPREESDGTSGDMLVTGAEEGKSSIGGASFNFINSIIGSGIIGTPSALQQSGFLFGIVLLLLVAAITDYTVLLLIRDGILAKKYTYQDMVTVAFGAAGYWYLTFVQFLFPFFAMAGYVVIVGDTLSRVLQQIFFLAEYEPPYILSDREGKDVIFKIVAVSLVMLPLSLLRNISKLEKFSAFAVVCIIFIVTVTFYELTNLYCAVRCFHSHVSDSLFTSWFINKSFVQGIGIMGAAFVCHHNTFLIYSSLSNRSLKRFSIVSHFSVFTSFIFCAVLGLSGFLTFGDETQGDLLNNYCLHDPVANSARFFFTCVIMLTYPIECFVAREVLEIALSRFPRKMVAKIKSSRLRNVMESFLYSPLHKSIVRHIVLTLLIVLATLAIGMSTNDLGVVLAFNGCFTAIPLAFIIPTACYLKLSKEKWCSLSKVVAFLVMLFGLLVMVIGTVLAVREAVESYIHDSPKYEPPYCSDSHANATCCRLFDSTTNFSSVALCDCTKLCPDPDLLPFLSGNYCNFSTENF